MLRYTPVKQALILAASIAILLVPHTAQADNLYWDTNGETPGSANSPGTWGTSAFWSTDSTGATATGAYIAGSDVFISAGTNATSGNIISVSGVQSANSITIEEGTVTIGTTGSGGLNLGAGGFTMNSGLSGNVVLSTNLGSGITLTASQQWNNNTTSRALTANAVIRGSAATGETMTFTLNDAGGGSSLGSAGSGGLTDGSNGGALALVKTGNGKLTLGANSNTYSGGTTINGGLLQFGTGANSVPTAGIITINSSGGLVATGPSPFNTVSGWLASGKIATSSTGVIAMASSSADAIDFSAGGYNDLFLGASADVTYTGTLTAGTKGYQLGGGGRTLTINSNLTQATTLLVGKTASVVLGGDNSYTGLTTVSTGSLTVNHANALGSTAAGTTVASGAALLVGSGITTNAGETVTISGTGISSMAALTTQVGATETATWAGGVMLNSSDARIGARAGTTLNVTGAIQGTGSTGHLHVSGELGTGTIIVSSSNNTYTGETRIVRGKLLLGANNALPTTTIVDMHLSGLTNDSSTFDLNGFDQAIAGLKRSSVNAATTVTNSAGGAAKTLTVTNQTTAYDYGSGAAVGTITGNLALAKGGNAMLTLSAANSYTGGTTVSGGTLRGAANGAFGAGDVSILDTAISLTIQTGVTDAIANTAALSLAGGGTLGTADFGYLSLATGVNETVNTLILNGVAQAPGVYGSSSSSAQFQDNEFFSGGGTLTVLVPEPSAATLLLPAFAAMLGTRRLRRKQRQ